MFKSNTPSYQDCEIIIEALKICLESNNCDIRGKLSENFFYLNGRTKNVNFINCAGFKKLCDIKSLKITPNELSYPYNRYFYICNNNGNVNVNFND